MKNITATELKKQALEMGTKIYKVKRIINNHFSGYKVTYAKVLGPSTVSTQSEVTIEGNLSDVLYHFTY